MEATQGKKVEGAREVRPRRGSSLALLAGGGAVVALAFAVSACSSPQVKEDPEPDGKGTQQQGLGEGDPDAWRCSGNLVPPTGWIQETAFVDLSEPNPDQKAVDIARSKLVGRLCGGGSNCDSLAARVDPWKQGRDTSRACAMVTIKSASVEEWRKAATSVKGLDAALDVAAAELLGDKAGKSPRVAIDKIVDGGVPGGERAEWLASRMGRALNTAGASVVSLPESWNGQGVPNGVDALISARSFERTESQRSVVEVTWVAKVRKGRTVSLRSAKPVLVPVDAAPPMNSAVTLFPPSDPRLTVHVESNRAGGGLCIGEETQVWLTADEALHVRVFDLYGEDGAVLLFPNSDRPDGRIDKNETIALGGDRKFEAVPVPNSEVERFLVIGAKTKKGLGRFESWSGYCKVPSDVAKQLHDGKGLPRGARASSDGFRLIDGAACSTPVSDKKREELEAQLKSLGECH